MRKFLFAALLAGTALTTPAFAQYYVPVPGAVIQVAPPGYEREREHDEFKRHRVEECVAYKSERIHEMRERHAISHDEAERMRDRSREECWREVSEHSHDHWR